MKCTIHLLISLVLTSLLIVGCNTGSSNELTQAQLDSIERAKQDSIRTADSLAKVQQQEQEAIKQQNEARKQELSKNFRVETDEFSDYSLVYYKSIPKGNFCTSFHLCFQLSESGVASNLQLCCHHISADGLLINKFVFNIDGKNYTYETSIIETEDDSKVIGGDLYFCEWLDINASKCKDIVQAIAICSSCKIKIIGSEGNNTVTLSREQLSAFKDTLEYYKLLGGKL